MKPPSFSFSRKTALRAPQAAGKAASDGPVSSGVPSIPANDPATSEPSLPRARGPSRDKAPRPRDLRGVASANDHLTKTFTAAFARGEAFGSKDVSKAILGLKREMSKALQHDVVPPREANQVASTLQACTDMICASAPSSFSSRQEILLHTLLLAGEMNHAAKHHGSLSGAPFPFVFQDKDIDAVACFAFDNGHVVSGEESLRKTVSSKGMTGFRPGDSVLMVDSRQARKGDGRAAVKHEALHGDHDNRKVLGSRDAYEDKEPVHPTADHPRSVLHEIARALPINFRGDKDNTFYRAYPMEVMSFLEQSYSWRLTSKTDLRLPKDCGLGKLAPLLADIAHSLDSQNRRHPFDSRRSKRERIKFDDRKHPGYADEVQNIMLACAGIEEAARSKAWSAEQAKSLETVMTAVDALLRSKVGKAKSPTDQLAIIADALTGFHRSLASASAGFALKVPAGAIPSEREFAEKKAHPADRAAVHLLDMRIERKTTSPQALAKKLSDAVEKEKIDSGFRSEVERLKRVAADGQTPNEAAVLAAIMKLVSPLIGLEHGQIPKDVVPELAFGPSGEIPHVTHLNANSGQRHKAHFEEDSWLLKLPDDFFDKPERMERRLAGLAFDVAFAVHEMALIGGRQSQDAERSDLQMGLTYGALSHVQAAVMKVAGRIGENLLAKEGSLGSLLKGVVFHTPVKQDGRVWKEGDRAAVKAASKRRDSPLAARAGEAYRAQASQRMDLVTVALRQLVKGPG